MLINYVQQSTPSISTITNIAFSKFIAFPLGLRPIVVADIDPPSHPHRGVDY